MEFNEILEKLPVPEDDVDKNASHSMQSSMWFSKRFFVTCLMFWGMINVSLIKLNVSIAIVEMTSHKPIPEGNRTIIQPAEFNWDTSRISLILNVYEYGGLFSFLFASIPSKVGGSTAYGWSTMLVSLLTLLIPISVKLDFTLLLLARFLTGLLENITYASRSEIFQNWFPLSERSRLMSLSCNGMFVGTTLAHLTCGVVAHKWGWPMVFYVTGFFTLVWSLVWLPLVPNHPSEDKWISKKELDYILEGTAKKSANVVTNPYRKIFTSTPFLIMCLCRAAQGWSLTTVVTCLPLYVKDATQKTTDLVGYISSIPSIISIFLIPFAGTMLDFWKNHSTIKITNMHKTVVGFNLLFGAFLLASTTFFSNLILTIMDFAIIRTFLSCNAVVLLMVIISMAPNHAGTISALSTFWYALGNITSQFAMGQMTSNHSIDEWNNVFILAAGFMTLSGTLFILCGSSEPQSWSKNSSLQNYDRKNIN